MEAHWLKLAPGLNKVPGGKTTPPNIFFGPILPKFEENFNIGVDEIGGCSMLPVRKTSVHIKYMIIEPSFQGMNFQHIVP